jgi:hypothetical protein
VGMYILFCGVRRARFLGWQRDSRCAVFQRVVRGRRFLHQAEVQVGDIDGSRDESSRRVYR